MSQSALRMSNMDGSSGGPSESSGLLLVKCQKLLEPKLVLTEAVGLISGKKNDQVIQVNKWVHNGEAGQLVDKRCRAINSSLLMGISQEEQDGETKGGAAVDADDVAFNMVEAVEYIVGNQQ